jgi:hypothetical protein
MKVRRMSDEFDEDYRNRVEAAIWAAIRQVSLAPGGAVVVRNHEVVSALTNALAMVAATSSATDTPAKLLSFAGGVAADLVKRTRAARRG